MSQGYVEWFQRKEADFKNRIADLEDSLAQERRESALKIEELE